MVYIRRRPKFPLKFCFHNIFHRETIVTKISLVEIFAKTASQENYCPVKVDLITNCFVYFRRRLDAANYARRLVEGDLNPDDIEDEIESSEQVKN